MFTKKFVRALLILVVALSFTATGTNGAEILFITADTTEIAFPLDGVIKDFFEGLGHTVTYMDDEVDEPTMEAAAMSADLVFISESCSSGNVSQKITEIETPMIVGEPWAWDEMGLTSGSGGGVEVSTTDITIINPEHFLAVGLSGTVPVLTGIEGEVGIARFSMGQAGNQADIIATATLSDGQTYDVFFVYEKGALVAANPSEGSPRAAPDIRVCTFFDYRAQALLNENAYEMLSASVNYALGITELARNPRPGSGAENTNTSTLQWTAGATADTHNVYFGTNSTLGPADLVSERQTDTIYEITDALIPGVTYYWRIDEVEVDGTTVHTGAIWNFTTAMLKASNPVPSEGATYVDPNASLSWTSGYGAVTHDVYLGTREADVNDATTSSPEFRANQSVAAFDPDLLAKGTTYYWRVDEVEADETTKYKGDIWSFSTLPDISIKDPNLVGWWKLDNEGTDVITDYSGHDNHGTFFGNLQWAIGFNGDAIEFDGASFVELPAEMVGTNVGSVAVWIKTSQAERGMIFYGSEGSSGDGFGSQNEFHVNVEDGGAIRIFLEGPSDINVRASALNDDAWHHITATWDINGDVTIYADGSVAASSSHNGNDFDLGAIRLGSPFANMRYYVGLMDDVRLYDYALSVDDVALIMEGDTGPASKPNPGNWAIIDIEQITALNWSPGENAAEHDVYLGTDLDTVAGADTSTADVYRGRQTVASYTPPEGFEWDMTYYWRIDEYNTDATISKGNVWSFTIADYLIVDNFEDYNDYPPNEIFSTWIDGWEILTNGSTIGYPDPDFPTGEHFVETTIVNSGSQSMPYFYDNTTAGNSEATMTLSFLRDWTKHGVNTLTLWFRGYPTGFKEEPAGTYTISASGTDIWGTFDEFRYIYKRLSGNGSITAQVLGVEDTDPWAKAGVMIRQTLEPDSKFAAVYITAGNGCRYQGRLTPASEAVSDTPVATAEQMAITAPYWIRVERDGSGFNGYYSSDGVSWVAMAWNPQTIAMPADVYIGLAVTSHNPDATCTGVFSDVQTTGTVSPQVWQQQAIGVEMPSNEPVPMYVVLDDDAIAYHENPNAALTDEWTQWDIDLQDFANQGVDLTDVDTLGIGFGDRSNPLFGGSGLVYFDDIRLYPPQPEPVQ